MHRVFVVADGELNVWNAAHVDHQRNFDLENAVGVAETSTPRQSAS